MSGRTKTRLLLLVNVAAIPYVAIRFPRELRGYLRAIWMGAAE